MFCLRLLIIVKQDFGGGHSERALGAREVREGRRSARSDGRSVLHEARRTGEEEAEDGREDS